MNIEYSIQNFLSNDLCICERKGIGHPDSLADMVADSFSNLYSEFTFKRYGTVLNHWVDKIVLRGGKATLSFGKAEILEPMKVYLFGRTTKIVYGSEINLYEFIEMAVHNVFKTIFNNDICNYIDYYVDTNDSIGADHPTFFYHPKTTEDINKLSSSLQCNDTVACLAYAPLNEIEYLTLYIENYINSVTFKKEHPYTGYDVKVMSSYPVGGQLDITICIPFISKLTQSYSFYQSKLKQIYDELEFKIQDIYERRFNLSINTKDKGKYAYLTVFGTALDKGDFGVVGRGNRRNGIISITRGMSLEAISGKNPKCHGGKIYNELAQHVSNRIFSELSLENYVIIVAKNGDSIYNPSHFLIKLPANPNNVSAHKIQEIIYSSIEKIESIIQSTIRRDPVKFFKISDVPIKKQ
jgi:S-adenosylmethionine synthetase